MQQKYFLYPCIALILLSASASHLRANSPSPSPLVSPSPVSLEDAADSVKKRLQESLAKNPTTKEIVKAYIGTIKDVIKDTLVVEDKDGKKHVTLSDSTTLLRSPGNATIKPEDIRIGDAIIAIGYPETEDELRGARLIISTAPFSAPAKTVGLGQISKIGKSSLELETKNGNLTLLLTSKTVYKTPIELIEVTDLSVGDRILYAATTASDETTATIIMRIRTTSLESPVISAQPSPAAK
jgi:hypothetical protein